MSKKMGRPKGSIYDPYYDQIKELLDSGYTFMDVYRQLFADQEGYEYQSYYYYTYTRGFRQQYVANNQYIPASCDSCIHCVTIERLKSSHYKDIKACLKTLKEINHVARPNWCPRERRP